MQSIHSFKINKQNFIFKTSKIFKYKNRIIYYAFFLFMVLRVIYMQLIKKAECRVDKKFERKKNRAFKIIGTRL